MNMIEVKNITKRFNDKLVLDNVSFSIEKGEIFGLLGPNGAGKSTLMNTIVGLVKMDKGEILVGQHDINKEPLKARRMIGLVPQDIALFEGLNARDNLEYWGGLYGLKGKLLKERIEEALKMVGLEDQVKKTVKKYSGGMKRRLNIAAAVLHHPEIIIMDEPTVGIDPQSRNYIFEMIQKINKERKTTIIYTSHYMEEVELLCNNIFIMDLGKEVAYGTKEELKRMVQSDKIINIKASGNLDILELELRKLNNIRKVHIDEEVVNIVCNDKMNLNQLLIEISKHDVKIRNISVEEISLEEVFLTLTGKSLRDKEV
ncbi:ABC transporter ATP-binding protein [Clostridium sp. SHJSY1]|uniref:ABC transporter ATP-binding protein n=1 Tax=Clostridium sp. SHJSY1 TaxID=2942483 RepID=UPI00287713BC|nr:ABC transporter ATP-binding protein [Clostridium sp. SHJSY1]MDS0525963.1 ABC transporter ATP-binding protein [Clostridium sp. SHJSY1]